MIDKLHTVSLGCKLFQLSNDTRSCENIVLLAAVIGICIFLLMIPKIVELSHEKVATRVQLWDI